MGISIGLLAWFSGQGPLHAAAIQVDTLKWMQITPTRYRANLNGPWNRISDKNDKSTTVYVPTAGHENGKIIYERQFVLPPDTQGYMIRLVAEAINYSCTILINGVFVAGHTGGYTRFEVPINPGMLKHDAPNVIRIEVDGSLDPFSTVPPKHRPFGWKNHTGILRDLYFERLPRVAIDDFHLNYEFSKTGPVRLRARVKIHRFGELESDTLLTQLTVFAEIRKGSKVEAVSPKIPFTLQGVNHEIETVNLEITDPDLWSPQEPRLYSMTLYLASQDKILDVIQQQVGMRKLEFKNGAFYLNGAPFVIKGIDWFDDLQGLTGDSLASAVQEVLSRLKTLGANTVRVVGYPAHPQFVQACSQEGLFVLEEIPVYAPHSAQMTNERFLATARTMLSELIMRDRNEPAIMAWGLGYRLQPHAPEAEALVSTLGSLVRELDWRPTYLTVWPGDDVSRYSDVGFFLVDYFEQFPGTGERFYESAAIAIPVAGYFVKTINVPQSFLEPKRRQIEAEELQAYNLSRALNQIMNAKANFRGIFIHALKDWQGEFPLLITGPRKQAQVYPAGLIDINGKQRIGYRMVASYYTGDRKPTISPNEEKEKAPAAFPIVGVAVILIFLFFLNRDKRLRGHLRRVFIHPHGFYMDIRENRKVPLFLTLLLGILEGTIWGGILAGWIYAFRDNTLLDEMLNVFILSPAAKELVVWLAWHPVWFIFAIAALYVLSGLATAFLLKLGSLCLGERLPFQQYTTLIFWTSSCYLLLGLVAPIFYRIVVQPGVMVWSLWVLLGFILWHILRLYRGIRVLYMMPALRAAFVLGFVIILLVSGISWYYQHTQGLFDVLAYYRHLIGI